jgi:chaperonin GroES
MDELAEPLENEAMESGLHEATEVETPVSLLDAISAPNLVDMLAASDVSRIGSDALREYQIDLASCEDFHKQYERAMDMALQRSKPKTFPWPNASNVIFPLLTQAAIQFQARAYPAIIDGDQVVKCKTIGPDPEGKKAERAARVAAHMNWQFLNDVPGWEEDTDKLLLQLPIVGCVFRKTWRDPVRNQNNSETVSACDFVVNIKTTSLEKAPRFTHRQHYYPHEIEAFIRSGIWAKVPYEGDDGSDPHGLVEVYEQFRLIDMDDDGLAEPYVVTLTTDGHVFRIAACFDADCIYMASQSIDGQVKLQEVVASGSIPEDLRVVRIERKDYFTKYGFIPAPDGSFYDMGFGTLTDPLGAAVNTLINQLIDAGTLSNMQGGFLSAGTKLRGGNARFTPGEWKRVEGVTSGPLRDNILPLQLPGPSPVLFNLLGMLQEAIQGITSVSDILSGNQDSQTAPTTALALIEQGQKVFTAIYQRIHRALGVEIKIMRGLNRDYLDVKEYFAVNDTEGRIGREDYQTADIDIAPVSDPRAINDRVKMAKAQVLMSHNGDPLVNQLEIRKREFEAAGISDVESLLKVPEMPPPPEALAAVAQAENAKAKTAAEVRSLDAATAKTLIEAAQAAYALGSALGDVMIRAQAQTMLSEAVALADGVSEAMKGQGNGEPVDQSGGLPPMEGTPGDGGIPAIPAGPGDGSSAPMGDGGMPIGADGAGPGADGAPLGLG